MSVPTNITCMSATVVSALPFTETVDTTGCPTDPLSPVDCGLGTSFNSVWYKLIIPPGIFSFDINTDGSSYINVISVWTGYCGVLTYVTCDQNSSGIDPFTGSVLWRNATTPGSIYYVLVASLHAGGGNLVVTFKPTLKASNQLLVKASTATVLYNRFNGSLGQVREDLSTSGLVRKDNGNIISTGNGTFELDQYLNIISSNNLLGGNSLFGFDRDTAENLYFFDNFGPRRLDVRNSTYPFAVITSYVLPTTNISAYASISKDGLNAYWPKGLTSNASNSIQKYVLSTGVQTLFASYGTNYVHPTGDGYFCQTTYTLTNGNVIGVFEHIILGVANFGCHAVIFDSAGNQLIDIILDPVESQVFLAILPDESGFVAVGRGQFPPPGFAKLFNLTTGASGFTFFDNDQDYDFRPTAYNLIIPYPTPFGTLSTQKIVLPSTPGTFTVNDSISTFTLENGELHLAEDVPAGATYDVTETTAVGYSTTYDVSNGSPHTAVTVDNGEDVIVTITNELLMANSGVYELVPGRTNDNLFGNGPTKFPDPFHQTALLGD